MPSERKSLSRKGTPVATRTKKRPAQRKPSTKTRASVLVKRKPPAPKPHGTATRAVTVSVSQRAVAQAARKVLSAQREYEAAGARARRESFRKAEQWVKQAQAAAPARAAAAAPVVATAILAEGDSWFRYDCGFSVIGDLSFDMTHTTRDAIANIAGSGATLEGMLDPKTRSEFDGYLSGGIAGKPFEVLLFSGGGNDVADPKLFASYLTRYVAGATPQACITQAFTDKMSQVQERYEFLVQHVGQLSPTTRILVNGYDFAVPDGRGVGNLAGPWMGPGFDYMGYPAVGNDRGGALRTRVVAEMLRRFAAVIQAVSEAHPILSLVQTQGTLTPSTTDWANELHPTNPAFRQITQKFLEAL
jgi:hypothetical protein